MSRRLIVEVLIIIGLISISVYHSFLHQRLSFAQQTSVEQTQFGRAETFIVSELRTHPTFYKELIVVPFKVKEGEKQYFSIWAKDPQGIDKVKATIKTDKREEVLNLKLVEGTQQEGRWSGSWRVRDISQESSYSTEFQAVNKKGEDTKMTCFWYRLED